MNGPNAIFVFRLALLNNNSIVAIIPPKTNVTKIQFMLFSKPSINDKGIASLTSPRPIPRPLVIKCKARNRSAKKKPVNKIGNRVKGLGSRNASNSNNQVSSSGMI